MRRFGVLTFAKGSFAEVAREWRDVEALGFNEAWLVDALVSLPSLLQYEAWTLLGALARETARLSIGTLVSIIPLRHPTLLAAEAASVDRISDGRLQLGVGVGEYGADNAALGLEAWSAGERIDRLGEQIAIIDRLLRGERVDHAGRFYRVEGAELPAPLQRPRPPLIIAAQGRRGWRLAARFGDGWNSLGGQPLRPADPIAFSEAVARTRQQVESVNELCRELGRDPASLRHSVLAFRAPFDPLASLDAFDEFVGGYAGVGIDEFVFYWPPLTNLRSGEAVSSDQREMLEQIAAQRLHPPERSAALHGGQQG